MRTQRYSSRRSGSFCGQPIAWWTTPGRTMGMCEPGRAALQRCGSRDAHEAMQSVGRKVTGRFTVLLHQVANAIVEEATTCGCSHIAFEDLTDIRERMAGAKRLHAWAFRQNHADYNAAKTIAFDLLRDQNGAEGGALVGVRTNGGTMTASGELLAHPAMG